MNEREPGAEAECPLCGLLASDCACPREPTREELEQAREERLAQAERRTRQ